MSELVEQEERGEAGASSDVKTKAPDINTGQPEQTSTEQMKERENRLMGYHKLQEENDDVVGWITVPGTRIDYPVMQTPDLPNFYLKHDFEKKKSSYGVPYASETCNLEADCRNVIIYGHHMKNGSMFADLVKYTDEAYYKEHPVMWFDTLERVGMYEIVGVVTASAVGMEKYIFDLAYCVTEEQQLEYIREIQKKSLYDTGQAADGTDHLVTLITCEYTQNEGRLALVAKKIEE